MSNENDQQPPADGNRAVPPLHQLVFDAASTFTSASERDRFLEFCCRGKPELRELVEALLGVGAEADDYFDFDLQVEAEDKAPHPDDEDGLGIGIGRYRLIERLGAGGCGVVYLAEQLEPVRRKVALKIVRLGLDAPEVVTRFEAESQALASMNHPSIARVLDAGRSAHGRPFFVMELVDGVAITEYCDAHRLGIKERLELFVKVSRAIQHAHQRGVVHRDIKPSNILVEVHESVAVPKVIDFGIASDIHSPEREVSESFLDTPTYVSPEQARGDCLVDTRTDIYSLGILLAELLSGKPKHLPDNLRDQGLVRMRQALQDTPPELPSAAIRSWPLEERSRILANRRVTERQLVAWCERELDWIVKKATSREPADRYATVSGLAADVMHWLEIEPVSARRQTRRYRLEKLVRRNWLLYLSGAIALSGLILGLGGATWLYLRERDARHEQARLRTVAELARAAEAHLRKKAQAGEAVANAAVLIRDGDIAGADRLLARIELEHVPASLEAVSSFQSVGDWHWGLGRPEEGSRRFAAVAQAITQVDKKDSAIVSIHFVVAAATLCSSGNLTLYERLREVAVDRFASAEDPVLADRVLKTCLLKPVPQAMQQRLDPLIDVLAKDLPWDRADDPEDLGEAWQTFTLSLASYRMGDNQSSIRWARRCLTHPNPNAPRNAAASTVLAMALHRSGQNDEARKEIEPARSRIQTYFKEPPLIGSLPEGFWYDWLIARLLLEEATNSGL